MFDARPGRGTPIDLAKMRSLSVGRLTRTRVREGRDHPETGRAWKATTTEAGTTVEHNTKNDRVDAYPVVSTVRAVRDPATGKVTQAHE